MINRRNKGGEYVRGRGEGKRGIGQQYREKLKMRSNGGGKEVMFGKKIEKLA